MEMLVQIRKITAGGRVPVPPLGKVPGIKEASKSKDICYGV